MKNPHDIAIEQAMEDIQLMRERYTIDTCSEAWRRLGGQIATDEWRRRTMVPNRPVLNVQINAESTVGSMKAMAQAIRDGSPTIPLTAAEKYAESVRFYERNIRPSPPGPGCGCTACSKQFAGLDSNDRCKVENIVENLRYFKPSQVAAAFRILAGVNGRCAFCAAGPGDAHAKTCPFALSFIPGPNASSNTLPRNPPPGTPGFSSFGSVPAPTPRPGPTYTPPTAQRDTIPAAVGSGYRYRDPGVKQPKGFEGSESLPYDSDYDG